LDAAHLAEHFYIGFVENLSVGRENGAETCALTLVICMLGIAFLPHSMKL